MMRTIRVGLVAAAAAALAAPGVVAGAGASAREAATCSASPEQTEGPYYTSGPPRRTAFVTTRTAGTRLLLTGRVLDTGCRPIAGARVDFWQANGSGNYDNAGYRFRGYQLTDRQGRYRLLTVVPGLYPGRTEHIHVKVTPPGGGTLTTQLYFPGVSQNTGDGIFDRRLVVRLSTSTKPWRAGFTFVVRR
jgi:protocatechuate 3,4-dioxygenase beta subunit